MAALSRFMKTVTVIGFSILLMLLVSCQEQQAPITSFEDCAAAGNPIMESYPRQCNAQGQTFVEKIDEPIEPPQEMALFHECTEQEKQAGICTMDYNPVCGLVDNGIRCVTTPCQSTDAKTFSNGCSACSQQALGYYKGACEDRIFLICKETVTGFDPKEIAKNINGICVDACPRNFDSFMTQIGIEQCIMHYGLEEINTWNTCTRSSESCDCVKAYETTSEEQIENTKYRCVPKQYADRLLFRGGVYRLNENGQGFEEMA